MPDPNNSQLDSGGQAGGTKSPWSWGLDSRQQKTLGTYLVYGIKGSGAYLNLGDM